MHARRIIVVNHVKYEFTTNLCDVNYKITSLLFLRITSLMSGLA